MRLFSFYRNFTLILQILDNGFDLSLLFLIYQEEKGKEL